MSHADQALPYLPDAKPAPIPALVVLWGHLKTQASSMRRQAKIPAQKAKRPAVWRLLDEHARRQGVKPLRDPRSLEGGFPADEDIDAFLEVIYSNRR